MTHLEKYISLSFPSWRRGLGRLIYLFTLSGSNIVRNHLQGRVLILLLITIPLSSIAQSNKKKVLVIPYGRFEFTSEYTLEEIAVKNDIASTEVYNAYQKSLLKVSVGFQSENFEFIAITDEALAPYKKYIKYVDGKFDGKNHYAIKMKSFPVEEFAKLMEANDASFIIFVNWYQIEKSSFVSRGKKRKRFKYSRHFVDYEIYNLFQQKIVGVGKNELDFGTPSDEEAAFKALRLVDVEKGYAHMMSVIIEFLNNPISNNKKK